MKVSLVQVDPIVGDFDLNSKKIVEAYEKAIRDGARLCMTPELAVSGYPPHDLLERPEIVERCDRVIADLARHTAGKKTALIVGHVGANPKNEGHWVQNVASVLENGKRVFSQAKTLLPTYDVFDESRYFEPAESIQLWSCDGKKIAIGICEDLWAQDLHRGRRIYRKIPAEDYAQKGAELVLSLSASPYEWGKKERRVRLHQDIARNLKCPLLYVNQVGATDEILFDGDSFAMNSQGEVCANLPVFKTAFQTVDLDVLTPQPQPGAQGIEILHEGLVVGIREYFRRTGFKMAILGLSGGIDSAVTACLAAEALGPENVLGVAMPSQFSSGHSLEDAEILARNLKIKFEVRPIKFQFSVIARELAERRGELAPIALENLQSRLRGNILMTLSNHYAALVLTTGNKTELATGYCTMYGDMVGALAPLGDVTKMKVYELAHVINRKHSEGKSDFPIPQSSITKAPSAELRPNQTDQDSLPPYAELDQLVMDYVEKGLSINELVKKHDAALGKEKAGWVLETVMKIERNEFKRRQAAPVLKVSSKAFGIGRRVPIAKTWGPSVV